MCSANDAENAWGLPRPAEQSKKVKQSGPPGILARIEQVDCQHHEHQQGRGSEGERAIF